MSNKGIQLVIYVFIPCSMIWFFYKFGFVGVAPDPAPGYYIYSSGTLYEYNYLLMFL